MVSDTCTPCAANIVAWLLGRSMQMENIQASHLLNLHLKTVSRLYAVDHIGKSIKATDAFVESHLKTFEVAAHVEGPETTADVFNNSLTAAVQAGLLQTPQQLQMVDTSGGCTSPRHSGEGSDMPRVEFGSSQRRF